MSVLDFLFGARKSPEDRLVEVADDLKKAKRRATRLDQRRRDEAEDFAKEARLAARNGDLETSADLLTRSYEVKADAKQFRHLARSVEKTGNLAERQVLNSEIMRGQRRMGIITRKITPANEVASKMATQAATNVGNMENYVSMSNEAFDIVHEQVGDDADETGDVDAEAISAQINLWCLEAGNGLGVDPAATVPAKSKDEKEKEVDAFLRESKA